jgi:hypothetical protein
MGLLLSMIFLTDQSAEEHRTLGTIIAIMIIFGVSMWYFGKKSEIKSAEEYLDKTHGTTPTLGDAPAQTNHSRT